MDEFALVVQGVGIRAGSKVAGLVHVQVLLVINHCQYPYIKLTPFVQ